jgi:hypothetical protein
VTGAEREGGASQISDRSTQGERRTTSPDDRGENAQHRGQQKERCNVDLPFAQDTIIPRRQGGQNSGNARPRCGNRRIARPNPLLHWTTGWKGRLIAIEMDGVVRRRIEERAEHAEVPQDGFTRGGQHALVIQTEIGIDAFGLLA